MTSGQLAEQKYNSAIRILGFSDAISPNTKLRSRNKEKKMTLLKPSWTVAVCLLATMAIVVGFKMRPTVAQAGRLLTHGPKQATGTIIRPAVPLLGAFLSRPVVPVSVVFDAASQPPSETEADVSLPPVEEIILTPPNPGLDVRKTTLSLRFDAGTAERLAAALPMTLGNQRVVLQRSTDDPAIYFAAVDFDWDAFAREQQQRQESASSGKLIPVFEGHRLLRMEPMQFVDAEQIHEALQSHQSIRFTPQVLQGDASNIIPDHELMITNIGIVEDPARTWDPCTGTGTKMGAWTFGALMTAIANDDPSTHLVADQLVQNWLDLWTIQLNVNHFPVSARIGMLGVLRNWRLFAQDRNGNVDVSQAPFQLNAIVNRIDLTSPSNPAGELRFVLGYAPCPGGGREGQPTTFNAIIEYHVPVAECSWATQWHSLDASGPRFNQALQAITDQVVTTNASKNLNQVRTNENFTSNLGIWEQRQFMLSSGALQEVPVPQTPNGDTAAGRTDFNQQTCTPNTNCMAGVLTNYINTFQQQILNNNYTVLLNFPGPTSPFLGGSALNGPATQQLVYWQGNPPPNSNQARSIFSENTCNGCHGRETFVNFRQVENRQAGPPSTSVPSVLSAFLVGCSTSSQNNPLTNQTGPCPEPPTNTCNLQNTLTQNPPCITWVQDPGDPSGQTVNQFAEISRRAQNLSTVLKGCKSDGLLYSLAHQHISSPH